MNRYPTTTGDTDERHVMIPADGVTLRGILGLPSGAAAVVLFAHGSGSSRLSPRNNYVARLLRARRLGTLLMDLLTEEEDRVHATRFDIDLLTRRLAAATGWVTGEKETQRLPVGYFGASTGAAAALDAAAQLGPAIGAVVSRGGRPDMAAALPRVESPTLLIVGGLDTEVIELNRRAYALLRAEKELLIIPGATHLFEEPGTLDRAADAAADWFARHLLRTA